MLLELENLIDTKQLNEFFKSKYNDSLSPESLSYYCRKNKLPKWAEPNKHFFRAHKIGYFWVIDFRENYFEIKNMNE